MRRITRLPLDTDALENLEALQKRVDSADDAPEKAKALWRSDRSELQPVLAALRDMAPGRTRCMYCEDNTGVDVEHFWPKSKFPARTFSWMNYLLACPQCNSNYKRAKFPRSIGGDPLLIDPTAEDPSDHLGVDAARRSLRTGIGERGLFGGHLPPQ